MQGGAGFAKGDASGITEFCPTRPGAGVLSRCRKQDDPPRDRNAIKFKHANRHFSLPETGARNPPMPLAPPRFSSGAANRERSEKHG
jgi:hypothetical protein